MLTMLVIWMITKKRQWPGDMRASIKVDRALAAGDTVDFEAENQAMSDQIQEATDQLLDKILLDASNLHDQSLLLE